MMMVSQSVAMCTSARVAVKAGASSAKPAGRVAVRVTAGVAGKGFAFDSKPRRGGLVVAHGKKEDAAKRALQGASRRRPGPSADGATTDWAQAYTPRADSASDTRRTAMMWVAARRVQSNSSWISRTPSHASRM